MDKGSRRRRWGEWAGVGCAGWWLRAAGAGCCGRGKEQVLNIITWSWVLGAAGAGCCDRGKKQVLNIITWSWMLGAAGWLAAAPAMAEPGLVTALRDGGAVVRELGVRGGLAGYFVELAAGDAYSLYVTGEGYGVAGLLYAPDGTLVTGRQLETAGVGESSGESTDESGERAALAAAIAREVGAAGGMDDVEGRFEAALAAFGFELGSEGPVAVVFADPGCRWSRSVVARLGQAAMGGRLRLKVVPVGVLGARAAEAAVGIASARSPALAWFADKALPMGDEGFGRIEANNALYEAWGEDSVPLIVYRSVGGVTHQVGMDEDVGAWIAGLR